VSNIALQIERVASGSAAVSGNVIFDTTVYSNGNISYNSATGVITFQEAGRYLINWWAAIQSSSSPNGVIFTLSSSQGDALVGNSPQRTGEVVGVGIINVSTTPVTVSLVNTSLGSHVYSSLPVKAALAVVQTDGTGGGGGSTPCYAVNQLSNILSQMITAYSATTWTVYTESLYAFSGMPLELYTAPGAAGPGILRLVDVNGDYEALPIANITAIYPGDGTLYNPSFTYLAAPVPLPSGCDADLLASVQSYLPLETALTLNLGPSVSASGNVYKNEFGVLVLSDEAGNTPIFIASQHILRIFTNGSSVLKGMTSNNNKPTIAIK
jgi:hypothetical protein